MQAEIDQWPKTIFPQYGIRVLDLVPDEIRADRWYADTDKGKKILDAYEDVQMLWQDFDVAEYLARHGYRRIPRMIRTLYGDPYVHVHDKWFVLTDWIDGRKLRFSPEDVLPAIRNLAAVHQALRGFEYFEYMEDGLSKPQLQWAEIMRASISDMESALLEWKKIAQKDLIQTRFLEQSELLQNQIRHVSSAFGSENMTIDPLDRCVGGAPFDQQWMSPSGKVYFRQVPKPIEDTPVFDLARCCLYAVEQGHSDAIADLIQEYEKIRELSEMELRQIATYASFPHGLWKLFYLYRRRRASMEQLHGLFRQTLDQYRQRDQQFAPYRNRLLQER
ncbi:hypothetical protein LSG31_20315 [Fodinisporobacter ferrooxydans]|uniref:Aminoglycoside phosphotransferase domain-containing protein n=1 Tax=Fodinisporobacter ferrooxydans TaxID=2901836 RepID=A0ABY4CI28_9BACL|nr:hypothetical protein LSG31_20315 [Alicyclobacillaceae bacterium MYW30-H2]